MRQAISVKKARQDQLIYRPNEMVKNQLRNKAALLFVGPAGVGKSTTLDLVAQLDDRFSRTGSIGTRPPSQRDRPGLYRQYSEDELLEKISNHDVVQYAIHPTTGNIYATCADMYTSSYNMLEIIPAGIQQFLNLGFSNVQIFYMVTDPPAWRQWFLDRYPQQNDEQTKRVNEAITSLKWALQQPDATFTWLNNVPGHQEETAKSIIRFTGHAQPATDYRNLAKQMLELTKSL